MDAGHEALDASNLLSLTDAQPRSNDDTLPTRRGIARPPLHLNDHYHHHSNSSNDSTMSVVITIPSPQDERAPLLPAVVPSLPLLSPSAAAAALAGTTMMRISSEPSSVCSNVSNNAAPTASHAMAIGPELPDFAYTLIRRDGSGYCRQDSEHDWKEGYPPRCWAVAVGCFPCGMLCCMAYRYRQCRRCGAKLLT